VDGAVAFVLKGYPRLSETFIAQEIRTLEQRGLDIRIISLRLPTDRAVHPVHREIAAPVTYLPEYLHQEPLRVARAWRRQRGRPGYAAARRIWLRDLDRDRTRNRVRRFGQALVLADELPADVGWLHAHFMHTPASVARYAAMLTGLRWSVSAHAKDIWTTAEWEKREKLADLEWLVTCTRFGADHLAALAPDPARVSLVYHGLDLDRFPAPTAARPARDGSDPADPARILSIGRLVEKKGYDCLMAALAALPADLNWRLVHIGGGELGPAIRAQARTLGLETRIDWRGTQPQDVVLDAYRDADLFVLASRIAGDGDRDGLPNVLMEAASQRLATVSTDLPGIAELVDDGRTGVLVEPGDAPALTAALAALIREPGRRATLGLAARARLEADFDHHAGVDALYRRFDGLRRAA